MMDLNSFKLIREQYLAGKLSKDDNESLYEYFDTKYSEDVNEGIIDSIISWFKRKMSPKALKLKKLGKEYYDWLMQEFDAGYKPTKDNPDLEKFLKRAGISDDIKAKIIAVAGDDKEYQDLANQIVLENQTKAKKDFCRKLTGKDSDLSKKLEQAFKDAEDKTSTMLKKLSADDSDVYKKMLLNLTKFIENTDNQTKEVAKTLAAGIGIFFRLRHEIKDFNYEDLKKEYVNGEGKITGKISMLNAITYRAIRSGGDDDGKSDFIKLNKTLDLDDLEDMIRSAVDSVNDVTSRMYDKEDSKEKLSGFWRFYIVLDDPDKQEQYLKSLGEYFKSNPKEDDLYNLSKSINDSIEKNYKTSEDPVEQNYKLLDKIENDWKTGSDVETDNDGKTDDEQETEEKPDEKTGDEQETEEKPDEKTGDKKYPITDKLKEDIEKSDKLINVVDAVILTVASTIKSSGGEGYSLSERISKSKDFKEFGLDNVFRVDNKDHLVDKNINDKMIEKAKNYLDGGLAIDDISSTKYDKAKVDEAVKSLKEDLTRTVNMYKNEIEKSESDAIEAFHNAANISRFFLAKELSEKPLTEEEIKEKFMFILDKKIGIAELETKKTTPE